MSELDPRVVQAYALLQSVVEDRDDADTTEPHGAPWHVTQVPLPLDGDEVSGTDMLALWLPDMATESARKSPWDAYFRSGPPRTEAPSPSLPPVVGELEHAAPFVAPEPLAPLPGGQPLSEGFEDPEALLDDRDADGAVDGLYAFVHAIGRLDVEAAMACVAAGYHGIVDDREIDRAGLRLWLDALVDRLRSFDEVDAYLAEIPEPIAHPHGVLIHGVIQIDGRSRDKDGSESKETLLFERLAVLNREPDGQWTLDALAVVESPRS